VTTLASEDPWAVAAPAPVVLAPGRRVAARPKPLRTILGLLDDAALLLLVALLLPVLILAVGTPIALLVRLGLAIAQAVAQRW
jgi:hypothetical protein